MSTMNVPRILVGGMIAGLIMNIGEAGLHAGLLGDDAAQLYARFDVPAPNPAANIPMLVGLTFLLGLGAVWLYAAIRPRFGAGPRTALLAGLAVWLFAHLWSGVYLGNGYPGIITPRLAWISCGVGILRSDFGDAGRRGTVQGKLVTQVRFPETNLGPRRRREGE